MLATLLALLHGVIDILRSRRDLTVENLALRQQLAIYERTVPRPKLNASDRLFWVTLRRGTSLSPLSPTTRRRPLPRACTRPRRATARRGLARPLPDVGWTLRCRWT
ncbi:MAG: hypothetical protein JXB32_21815, partial [Deltaproteobacteria bacterium]|nr:hypothetical protein [Deltaproteobacteria bacterium]